MRTRRGQQRRLRRQPSPQPMPQERDSHPIRGSLQRTPDQRLPREGRSPSPPNTPYHTTANTTLNVMYVILGTREEEDNMLRTTPGITRRLTELLNVRPGTLHAIRAIGPGLRRHFGDLLNGLRLANAGGVPLAHLVAMRDLTPQNANQPAGTARAEHGTEMVTQNIPQATTQAGIEGGVRVTRARGSGQTQHNDLNPGMGRGRTPLGPRQITPQRIRM